MGGIHDMQMSAKDRISGGFCVEESKLSLNEKKLAISRCVCLCVCLCLCVYLYLEEQRKGWYSWKLFR